MGKELLVLATPIFLVSAIWEMIHLKRGGQAYDIWDALASISMGVGNLIVSGLMALLISRIYLAVYEYRLLVIKASWLSVLVFVLLEDYAYYWFHRISHEARLWWCAHETHHSSQSYNFTTAVRQTWTGAPISWIFWTPLVWMGFPPSWVITQQALSLIFQFFLHTETIHRLGPLEWFLNTPSHHRVHHGTNIKYLDRNYAGILIIWDRLHGTFQKEEERPMYGTLDPLRSYNPLTIAFHMWLKLFGDIGRSGNFLAAMRLIFLPPGWKPDGTGITTRKLQKAPSH